MAPSFSTIDGGNILAELVVGNGKGQGLLDGSMIKQRLIDFGGRNFLAAAVDDLLQAAGDLEIAVLIHVALVAGVEPAMGEGGFIGLRVVLIALGHVGPAGDNFAFLAAPSGFFRRAT